MKELTSLQKRVLSKIRCFKRKHDRVPTLAEIAKSFRWKSVNSASNHVSALLRKGALEKDGFRFRIARRGSL